MSTQARRPGLGRIKADIHARLSRANARRRVRTLGYDDIVQALRECVRDGYGCTKGGVVANKYGYPATTTSALAIEWASGQIALDIGGRNANKSGGYGVHLNGFSMRWPAASMCRFVAEYVAFQGPTDNTLIHLTRRQAQAIVRADDHARELDRAEAQAYAIDTWGACPVPRDLTITYQDSINAGNCPAESRRVQAALGGRDAVPAGEIWDWLRDHAQQHRDRAIRAFRLVERRGTPAVCA